MSALTKGTRYVGTATGVRRGARIFNEVQFVASRDQDLEPFIRDRATTPDQDRVFIDYQPFGSVPRLFVAGSIREVAS